MVEESCPGGDERNTVEKLVGKMAVSKKTCQFILKSLKGIDYTSFSLYTPLKVGLSPLYSQTPRVKPSKSPPCKCSCSPPVLLCYVISTNDYGLLWKEKLIIEAAKIAERNVEKRDLRRKPLKNISLLPSYPRLWGLRFGRPMVPVPALSQLAGVSDEDLLVTLSQNRIQSEDLIRLKT